MAKETVKSAPVAFNLFDEVMEEKPSGLQLIVLAPSGTGKSYLAGTYPGKVLFVCGDSEQHGIKSSRQASRADILPVCWGRRKDGSVRSADAGYKLIKQLLEPETITAAGVQCVVLDSLTDLMKTVADTQEFQNRCLSTQGKHDRWKEPDAYVAMIDPILSQLRMLQEFHNIDFMVTCDLEISQKAENGAILESKPRLPSFTVAERLVQQFQDIIMMSRISKGDETKPVIQMGAMASRQSKNDRGVVVKTVDFHPRLADVKEIPRYIKADLQEILKLKGK